MVASEVQRRSSLRLSQARMFCIIVLFSNVL